MESITSFTTHLVAETSSDFHIIEQQLLTNNNNNSGSGIQHKIYRDSYIDYCIENEALKSPLYKHEWIDGIVSLFLLFVGLFGSMTFIIYQFEKDTDRVCSTITSYGGKIYKVLEAPTKEDLQKENTSLFNYVVCPRTITTNLYECEQCVSIYWLKDCLLKNVVFQPDKKLLYRPQIPLLEGKAACLSGFAKEEKLVLEKLIVYPLSPFL